MVGKEIHTTIVRSSTPQAVLATRALGMWGTSTFAMKTGWGQSVASQVSSDFWEIGKSSWKLVTRDYLRFHCRHSPWGLAPLQPTQPCSTAGWWETGAAAEVLWDTVGVDADTSQQPGWSSMQFFLVVNSTLIQVPCGKRGKNGNARNPKR